MAQERAGGHSSAALPLLEMDFGYESPENEFGRPPTTTFLTHFFFSLTLYVFQIVQTRCFAEGLESTQEYTEITEVLTTQRELHWEVQSALEQHGCGLRESTYVGFSQ